MFVRGQTFKPMHKSGLPRNGNKSRHNGNKEVNKEAISSKLQVRINEMQLREEKETTKNTQIVVKNGVKDKKEAPPYNSGDK